MWLIARVVGFVKAVAARYLWYARSAHLKTNQMTSFVAVVAHHLPHLGARKRQHQRPHQSLHRTLMKTDMWWKAADVN